MKKKTLLGILLNVAFILSIFTVRYFTVKKEYDFLKNDSERQEQLIVANESSIDSLSAVTRRLQIDNDTQDKKIKKYSTDLYEIVRWSKVKSRPSHSLTQYEVVDYLLDTRSRQRWPGTSAAASLARP